MVYLKHTSLINITTVILPAFSMGVTGDDLKVHADLVSVYISHCSLPGHTELPLSSSGELQECLSSVLVFKHTLPPSFPLANSCPCFGPFKTCLPPEVYSVY